MSSKSIKELERRLGAKVHNPNKFKVSWIKVFLFIGAVGLYLYAVVHWLTDTHVFWFVVGVFVIYAFILPLFSRNGRTGLLVALFIWLGISS